LHLTRGTVKAKWMWTACIQRSASLLDGF